MLSFCSFEVFRRLLGIFSHHEIIRDTRIEEASVDAGGAEEDSFRGRVLANRHYEDLGRGSRGLQVARGHTHLPNAFCNIQSNIQLRFHSLQIEIKVPT